MTNPIFNPQPNYSGVTIQISNPAVNVGGNGNGQRMPNGNGIYITSPQTYDYPQQYFNGYNNNPIIQGQNNALPAKNEVQMFDENENPIAYNPDNHTIDSDSNGVGYQNSYPADYYLNNYKTTSDKNSRLNQTDVENSSINSKNPSSETNKSNVNNNTSLVESNRSEYRDSNSNLNNNEKGDEYNSPYKSYSSELDGIKQREDLTTSKSIIDELTERNNTIQEEKKNAKETKIVALTDEYIKSLENYLNNPNDEIRLMASKEVLTRLDEDKDRYDDAALNALLNKMLQDPAKLVRIAALSAFASGLASGNNYTVQLLNNMQSNPNADKEDVLQAADILLKMSAGVEVKRIPNPAVKDNPQQ